MVKDTKNYNTCRKIQNLPTSTYILITIISKIITISTPKKYLQNFSAFSKSSPDTGDGDGDCDRQNEMA